MEKIIKDIVRLAILLIVEISLIITFTITLICIACIYENWIILINLIHILIWSLLAHSKRRTLELIIQEALETYKEK